MCKNNFEKVFAERRKFGHTQSDFQVVTNEKLEAQTASNEADDDDEDEEEEGGGGGVERRTC
jgi:hypothetical protein